MHFGFEYIGVCLHTGNCHEPYTDIALTNINMYAIFALLSLLLLLLLPGDNADLLKINYGKLLEQCIAIMMAVYSNILFAFDCMHSFHSFAFSHHSIMKLSSSSSSSMTVHSYCFESLKMCLWQRARCIQNIIIIINNNNSNNISSVYSYFHNLPQNIRILLV